MNDTVPGRVGHLRRMAQILPLFFLALSGCREGIPPESDPEPADVRFALLLNAYYSYDNWKLDPDGFHIPSSKFRSAWRVTDTSAVVAGFQGVAIVIDSTFAKDAHGVDSLVRTEYRYFQTSPNGEVFEFGFIARLIEQHDTVDVGSRWDKLLSPPATANTSWIVEAGDSLAGGNIYGTFFPAPELVGATINGVQSGVLAYHVQVTGRNLDVHVWISGTPSAFARFRDDSPGSGTRIFQELVVLTNAQ